jgi:hypothetical protein
MNVTHDAGEREHGHQDLVGKRWPRVVAKNKKPENTCRGAEQQKGSNDGREERGRGEEQNVHISSLHPDSPAPSLCAASPRGDERTGESLQRSTPEKPSGLPSSPQYSQGHWRTGGSRMRQIDQNKNPPCGSDYLASRKGVAMEGFTIEEVWTSGVPHKLHVLQAIPRPGARST